MPSPLAITERRPRAATTRLRRSARNTGDPVFDAAVAALEAGRDAVASVRDDLEFEGWPAPKRLAPHAVALAATAFRDGEEAGEGKLMLLYDPAGQDGWTGTFRIVIQVQADVEEEMAADPLLGEVGWSWLTDALDLHAPGYAAPSGTVTRVITEGYGAKADDLPATGFELRASWCPADDGDLSEVGARLRPSLGRDRRRGRRLVRAAGVGGRAARGGHARDRRPGGRARAGGPDAGSGVGFRFRRAAAPMTAASEESEEQTPDAVALSADADDLWLTAPSLTALWLTVLWLTVLWLTAWRTARRRPTRSRSGRSSTCSSRARGCRR